MKILHIRFCNLNSLAGSWSIDLTAPEYLSDGIFAITGPTGAGKTTILDAVCLALYGKTPRLQAVTKSANEIMTRQTGECWAEVEFSTGKGRYRCHWSQHRSRKSPQGELQAQKHEIIDCSNNKVIESKIRMVEKKVTDVTGMTFDQFTRSILLAQGDFDTFLKAKADERAPILEQITGTEMYSRISKKVHERKGAEQLLRDQLVKECDGFMPLDEEQLTAIRARLIELAKNTHSIEKEIASQRNLLDWHATLGELQVRITALTGQSTQHEKEWQELASERVQLDSADKARLLEPVYTRLSEQRTLQTKEEGDLKENTVLLHNNDKELENTIVTLANANKHLSERKTEQKQLEILLREVRGLDQQIDLLQKQHKELEKDLAKDLQARDMLNQSHSAIQQKIAILGKECSQLKQYRESHCKDQQLIEEFSGIRQQASRYTELLVKNASLSRQIDNVQNTIVHYQQQANKQKLSTDSLNVHRTELQHQEKQTRNQLTELLQDQTPEQLISKSSLLQEQVFQLKQAVTFCENLGKVKDELNKLLAQKNSLLQKHTELTVQQRQIEQECTLRAESVEKQQQIVVQAIKIKNYEQERQHLHNGEPCPLCGALEHPFCNSSLPVASTEQEQLQNERALLLAAQKKERSLLTELAGLQANIEQNTQVNLEKQQLSDATASDLADLCRKLEIQPDVQISATLAERTETIKLEYEQLQQKRKHIETLKTTIENITVQQTTLERNAHTAEQLLQKIQLELQKTEEQLQLCQTEHTQQTGLIAEYYQPLSRLLAPYTDLELTIANCSELMKTLESRRQQWLQSDEKLRTLTLQSQQYDADSAKIRALIENQDNICTEKKAKIGETTKALTTLSAQRSEKFAEQNTTTAEQQMLAQVEQAEHAVTAAQTAVNMLQQKQATLTERVTTLGQRINDRVVLLQQILDNFQTQLADSEFQNEDQFLEARIPLALYSELAEKNLVVQKKIDETKTLLQSAQKKLEEEHSKKLTELSPDSISTLLEGLIQQISELQQETGALSQQLKENDKQQERHTETLKKLVAQNNELERWERLHELIGSNDGKKFRNFAQGLTFDIMISHANSSLQKMSDRYLLVRDPGQPLELHVIDNYQAGERRSTKNLSGGESFIVSMALALGLSSMASHKVQVDSLFLDEGFGTLDEESLQTALDTLSGLHQEGKLIGIISHVSGLQERISTRIKVSRGLGGLSSLSGPGTSRWSLSPVDQPAND
jgi:exonuclease SbcC